MPEGIHATVEELRLLNYRAFGAARLRLADLTFLVGRNGAGKSSLLEAVALLREAVTDNLENALDRRGGLLKVRRLAADSESAARLGVAIVLSLRLPTGRRTRAIYGFELSGKSSDPSYEVRECLELRPERSSFFERAGERFDASRKTGVSPPPANLVLPLIARSDSVWEAVYEAVRRLRSYDLVPGAMVASSKIGQGTSLETDGANAGDALKAIEGSDDHRWVVRHLAALTPGIADVRTEAVLGRRVLVFIQEQQGVRREYDASQISQGTLRGLGILLALRQRPTPSLVLVDEVENSVHPSALGVLLDAAEASRERTRVVFTTHSPEALDHLAATGGRLRVVEWSDGTSRIHRLNAETRAAVSEIETVGSMLRSNALWPEEQPETWTGDFFALEEESGG
jgi:predicted ATPase